jgi:hypothetical protein
MYEMAMTGMAGRIKEVQELNMWEFFDMLAYVRSQAEYRRRLSE